MRRHHADSGGLEGSGPRPNRVVLGQSTRLMRVGRQMGAAGAWSMNCITEKNGETTRVRWVFACVESQVLLSTTRVSIDFRVAWKAALAVRTPLRRGCFTARVCSRPGLAAQSDVLTPDDAK